MNSINIKRFFSDYGHECQYNDEYMRDEIITLVYKNNNNIARYEQVSGESLSSIKSAMFLNTSEMYEQMMKSYKPSPALPNYDDIMRSIELVSSEELPTVNDFYDAINAKDNLLALWISSKMEFDEDVFFDNFEYVDLIRLDKEPLMSMEGFRKFRSEKGFTQTTILSNYLVMSSEDFTDDFFLEALQIESVTSEGFLRSYKFPESSLKLILQDPSKYSVGAIDDTTIYRNPILRIKHIRDYVDFNTLNIRLLERPPGITKDDVYKLMCDHPELIRFDTLSSYRFGYEEYLDPDKIIVNKIREMIKLSPTLEFAKTSLSYYSTAKSGISEILDIIVEMLGAVDWDNTEDEDVSYRTERNMRALIEDNFTSLYAESVEKLFTTNPDIVMNKFSIMTRYGKQINLEELGWDKSPTIALILEGLGYTVKTGGQ